MSKVNDQVNITCSTSGDFAVNFEWKSGNEKALYEIVFTGGEVSHAYISKFAVTKEIMYTLTLLNASQSDAGTFKCVDNNGGGPDESTATLSIVGW